MFHKIIDKRSAFLRSTRTDLVILVICYIQTVFVIFYQKDYYVFIVMAKPIWMMELPAEYRRYLEYSGEQAITAFYFFIVGC